MNPSLNSHTHCQVAQADTQAKTWQRVCLPNRMTDRKTDEEKEALGGNKRYSKCGYACSLKHLESLPTFVLA
jgi:hypothetical protein